MLCGVSRAAAPGTVSLSLIACPFSGSPAFAAAFPASHSGGRAAPGSPCPVGFPCDLQAHRKRPAVPRPRPWRAPVNGRTSRRARSALISS
ncbi:hypothetical protein STXM2123_5804 [Streptomyces sp. F-3]|nr:hypothetical protein STXM2123_5804 [Streptomyces sp. F-3]